MTCFKRGFTLIELIVVIAITAILAAILFPVFAQAKRAAQSSVCISNQKQLALGVLMYVADADGTFPGYVQDTFHLDGNATPIWNAMIQPYVKNQSIFLDPLAASTRYGGDWGTRGWPSIGLNTHYGLWLQSGLPLRVSESEIEAPSRTVLLAGSAPGDTNLGYKGYIVNAWNHLGFCGHAIVINGPEATLTDRHAHGDNVALVDGHAKWYRIEALVPNRRADPADWCQCTVDANAAGLKWLVVHRCTGD